MGEFYICSMLNIGLIGDIKIPEPFAKKIYHHPVIHIAGKSSTGPPAHPENFGFLIPELNRIDLIERSDALMINNFSLLSFQTICSIVKKSKHIFALEYPDIDIEECRQLVNLAREAKTIVQVTNPFSFLPAIRWLNRNLNKPAFIDISLFENSIKEPGALMSMLLMLKESTGIAPKNIGALSFHSASEKMNFNNVRLQYGDASVVNMNFGQTGSPPQFTVKAWSAGQDILLHFTGDSYQCNNFPINLSQFKNENELDLFVEKTINNTIHSTGIEDYLTALQTIQKIKSKLSQFSTIQPG